MTKTILFESDFYPSKCGEFAGQVEIEIDIQAYSHSDVDFNIVSIYNLESEKELRLSDFPDNEQRKILAKCNELADVYGAEAWQDYLDYKADMYVDWCKENN